MINMQLRLSITLLTHSDIQNRTYIHHIAKEV